MSVKSPFLDVPQIMQFSDQLLRDLRTDHAGETGAVAIYHGILAVSRDARLRAFAQAHLATEQSHLARLETVLLPSARSRLLWLWRLAGWLTGALPALMGPRAVYGTIVAVETFVDRHYQAQIDRLDGVSGYDHIRRLLAECQADEVHHRDEARHLSDHVSGPLLRVWTRLVTYGSSGAVALARRI